MSWLVWLWLFQTARYGHCGLPSVDPSGENDRAQLLSGAWIKGNLVGTPGSLVFETKEGVAGTLTWSELRQIEPGFVDERPVRQLTPAFIVMLSDGGRLFVDRVKLDKTDLQLESSEFAKPLRIPRAWVQNISQRPGQTVVFSHINAPFLGSAWKRSGLVEPLEGSAFGVRLGGPISFLKHQLTEEVVAGQFELIFEEPSDFLGGEFQAELGFRLTGHESSSLVFRLGSASRSYEVEFRGGPSLAIQRLVRKAGEHRLVIRWGPKRTDVLLDGNELAHGVGLDSPLREVALQMQGLQGKPGEVFVRGVQVVQMVPHVAKVELEPGVDSVVSQEGDQLFGKVSKVDGSGVTLQTALGSEAFFLPWRFVTKVIFTRSSVKPEPVSGQLARMNWGPFALDSAEGTSQLEAVILGLNETEVRLFSPMLGEFNFPRAELRSIAPLGVVNRLLIDPWPHHLGHRYDSRLEPPYPEGSRLEHEFEIAQVPQGPAFLVLDVLGVVGVEGTPPFSEPVKNGQLRTHVEINGQPLSDLNEVITFLNSERARVRLAIPQGLLQKGKNRLQFSQDGTTEDPETRDNLSVLTTALEWMVQKEPPGDAQP